MDTTEFKVLPVNKKFLHFLIALLLSHCMIEKKFKLIR